MRIFKVLGFGLPLALLMLTPALAQDDEPGSKDHPLFTRIPGYYISNYEDRDFDSAEFPDKDGNPIPVEGRKTFIGYVLKDGARIVSPLQIARNYQNALAKIGGVVLFQDLGSGGGQTSMKLVRGTSETWVFVLIGDSGQNYNLTIVEKGGMEQSVVANADALKSDINSTGHVAVYGVYFDTGKAVVKPESEPALQEIVKLLNADPKLSLLVVGHTDSTGEIPQNMTLSEARAKAVVAALTAKGVAPSRLSPYGCGPLAPVASNDDEAGRAENRRVELVKR
jgi:OOP family OmpA-OmpF porin